MGATKRLNQFYKTEEKKKLVEENSVAKYIFELTDELEDMYSEYPHVCVDFKTQIQLIRSDFEATRKVQDQRKDVIKNAILKKAEEKLLELEQDYQNKEMFLTMNFLERERDEVKEIISNYENKTGESDK